MAEILGVGLSHYPPLSSLDSEMAALLKWTLNDPAIPVELHDPARWPATARREWGDDGGVTAAASHRAALLVGFRRVREAIDAFGPDVVLIWGDDQYENFREDVIPPYAVLAYDDMTVQPWKHAQHSSNMVDRPNIWGESAESTFTIRGAPDVGRLLTGGLLEREIDVAYAYEPLHHPGLPHAFLNTVLYLDYDRSGFPYAVLPFAINCYGRRVISFRGFASRLGEERPFDPPSASPRRLAAVGAATVDVLRESAWRVALVASSSWSHAFMCDKTLRLWPDTESDRRLYESLGAGDVDAWLKVPLEEIEGAGQQELLNWFPLMGAMAHLGRQPTWTMFVETGIFNSNKVFALYEP